MEFGSNNILNLAVELGLAFERLGLPYCWIGGVAVQRWAKPRQTTDVDAMVFAGFGSERVICGQLLDIYHSRVESPLELAVQGRIVLLENTQGTDVNISLGGLPYEQRVIERSSYWEVPEHGRIKTCSAEDLVVLKAVANRPKRMDRGLVFEELQPLVELKDEPEILEELKKRFRTNSPPERN